MRGILSILESRKERKKQEEATALKEANESEKWINDGLAEHQYALRKPNLVFLDGQIIEYGYKYKCDDCTSETYGKRCGDPDCRVCIFCRR